MTSTLERAQHITLELAHRREYEHALKYAERTGPAWEDLPEEVRQNIREANVEFWADMRALGDEIRKDAVK